MESEWKYSFYYSTISYNLLLVTFYIYWQHFAAADSFPHLLTTFCSCWQHSAAADNILQLLTTFCSCWQHSASADSILQLLTAFCSCWQHAAADSRDCGGCAGRKEEAIQYRGKEIKSVEEGGRGEPGGPPGLFRMSHIQGPKNKS